MVFLLLAIIAGSKYIVMMKNIIKKLEKKVNIVSIIIT